MEQQAKVQPFEVVAGPFGWGWVRVADLIAAATAKADARAQETFTDVQPADFLRAFSAATLSGVSVSGWSGEMADEPRTWWMYREVDIEQGANVRPEFVPAGFAEEVIFFVEAGAVTAEAVDPYGDASDGGFRGEAVTYYEPAAGRRGLNGDGAQSPALETIALLVQVATAELAANEDAKKRANEAWYSFQKALGYFEPSGWLIDGVWRPDTHPGAPGHAPTSGAWVYYYGGHDALRFDLRSRRGRVEAGWLADKGELDTNDEPYLSWVCYGEYLTMLAAGAECRRQDRVIEDAMRPATADEVQAYLAAVAAYCLERARAERAEIEKKEQALNLALDDLSA